MKIFYNDDYVASPHEFTTTRKSELIQRKLQGQPGLQIVDPIHEVSLAEVERLVALLHDARYVDALRTGSPEDLAESSTFSWGPSTYKFAIAHSHGVLAAVAAAMSGKRRAGTLSSGLHHARPDSGFGYCTLNGLAIGAAYAASHHRRVVILDFDAHFGGGTMLHLGKINGNQAPKVVQVDVSVSKFDDYKEIIPHYRRFVACADSPDMQYLVEIEKALGHAEMFSDDETVIIYNAGVDPVNNAHFDDPFGTMLRRDQMVSDWVATKPAIFTLAGGYTTGFTIDEIIRLHLATIETWIDGV